MPMLDSKQQLYQVNGKTIVVHDDVVNGYVISEHGPEPMYGDKDQLRDFKSEQMALIRQHSSVEFDESTFNKE